MAKDVLISDAVIPVLKNKKARVMDTGRRVYTGQASVSWNGHVYLCDRAAYIQFNGPLRRIIIC